MGPVKLKEREIKSIRISDGDIYTIYEKERETDIVYLVAYGMPEDKQEESRYSGMCGCCGHLFEEREWFALPATEEFKCPYCNNLYEEIHYKEIPELVYSMLEDDLEVTIVLWSGFEYNFKL